MKLFALLIVSMSLVSCVGLGLQSEYGTINTDKEGNTVIVIRPLNQK